MTEHEHDTYLGLDNIIRCRTCGKEVISMIVASVTSAARARRVLDEIAVAGGYSAVASDGDFVVYRDNKGLEITVTKIAERRYDVIKRMTEHRTGTL